MFEDRTDAGRRLAEVLADRVSGPAVVLAIPRGGVVVGVEVARRLGAPLDVVVPRKLGAPGNPELGVGAIAPGVRVVDPRAVRLLRISDEYLEREVAAQEREIARRERIYRGGRDREDLAGATAVVVDDGIATGGTAIAALRWARGAGSARVVLGVPVAPAAALERLAREADEVIVLATPEPFMAVGEWYRRFDQTSDDEVVRALESVRGTAA